jgi:hypothetical protein
MGAYVIDRIAVVYAEIGGEDNVHGRAAVKPALY